jgi:hypothetical protein
MDRAQGVGEALFQTRLCVEQLLGRSPVFCGIYFHMEIICKHKAIYKQIEGVPQISIKYAKSLI